MQDISSNQHFKVALADLGVIKTAMELASRSDIGIIAIAFGIIRHLSVPMLLKRKLSDCGIVSMMVQCVSQSDNEELCYECSSSMANMAEHAQNRLNLVQFGVVPCLVFLCNHTSFRVKRETARAFSLLSSSPELVGVFDEHILPHVLTLLRTQDEETGRDGASTVFNISTGPEMIKLVGAMGGIAPLLLLLESSHVSCQSNSCRALCRLTILGENKGLFLSNGGMKPLLQLCMSSNLDVSLFSTMVLCNLTTSPECHSLFIEGCGLPILKGLLSSDRLLVRKNAMKVLCNLTSHDSTQVHVARQANLSQLIDMMNDADSDCRAYAAMTLCNLASNQNYGSAILGAGRQIPFATIINSAPDSILLRSTLSMLYNMSSCEESHLLFVEENIVQSIVNLVAASPDILCRRLALMILTNVACNHQTRVHTIRGGGLQSAMLALKDGDQSLSVLACICLANMSNDAVAHSQIVVHGGLLSLVNHCLASNSDIRNCASMCLANLAENESNHLPMIKQGAFKAFVDRSASQNKRDLSLYIAFGIANLASNVEMLSKIGRCGAMKPLMDILKSNDLLSQCLALASLRHLATIGENRDRLMEYGIINALIGAVNTAPPEIRREVASCFCNLSLSSKHRICIARSAMSELVLLAKKDEFDTVKSILGTIGNLAEDIATHSHMKYKSVLGNVIIASLDHEDIDIKREAARAISNLLSSSEIHAFIIQRGLRSLILLSTHSCQECRYLTALIFRKLSVTVGSHGALINDGLLNIISLANDEDRKTRMNALAALRELSATDKENISFFNLGLPATLAKLVNEADNEIRLFALTILRHLSSSDRIIDVFFRSGIMPSVLECISREDIDLRCQVAGLFANLSEHVNCQSTMISNGILYAIGTILPIEEHNDIWQVRLVAYQVLVCH